MCLVWIVTVTARSLALSPKPIVEIEEDVYSFASADNGAGPMWTHGNTCIVRIGEAVFASGLETLPEIQPLNNVRWLLFKRGANGWDRVAVSSTRTREPCPLACFPDSRLFLSDNPTLTPIDTYGGPAKPVILAYTPSGPFADPCALAPVWDGEPAFTEHSYRSFAADGATREWVLFQNIGYGHAEWSFLDRQGQWAARGKLKWPWGGAYAKPQPIRLCYPNVALKDRQVYFCGVSDIIEPNPEWRQYKKEITGRDWDYDFRRLFFTWSDDIRTGRFHEWVEVSSRESTCGWIFPCDLWVAGDGRVHLLWSERALDTRLRETFFPDEKQTHALNYAVVEAGQVVLRRSLQIGGEGMSDEIPGRGRFHVTDAGRLIVFYYVSGPKGSENRIMELHPDGSQSPAIRVDLKHPFTSMYTATWRAGCKPSKTLDVYGQCAGKERIICYARIKVE
jgi:hypothetical protein